MVWLIIIEMLTFFGPNSTLKMSFNQELEYLMLLRAGLIDFSFLLAPAKMNARRHDS